jgi:clostripain
MSGLDGFEPGKNSVFMVFPDMQGWRKLPWYTPFESTTRRGPNGGWAFLLDDANPDDGVVDNWFELMDCWYDDTSSDPGGINGYLW